MAAYWLLCRSSHSWLAKADTIQHLNLSVHILQSGSRQGSEMILIGMILGTGSGRKFSLTNVPVATRVRHVSVSWLLQTQFVTFIPAGNLYCQPQIQNLSEKFFDFRADLIKLNVKCEQLSHDDSCYFKCFVLALIYQIQVLLSDVEVFQLEKSNKYF